MSFTFAIVKGIMDGKTINSLKNTELSAEKKIHCKYGVKKIEQIHNIFRQAEINNKDLEMTVGDLEVILNSICLCCHESYQEEFDEYRKIPSDTKTDLLNLQFSPGELFNYL